MSLLSGQDLDYSIDGVTILKGINICVNQGEMVGLIGPNGAGKSSLLRLLTGVETCSHGEISFDMEPLQQISLQRRAQIMGYLVQGAMAYWPFSVEKVVGLGRIPYQTWWQQATAQDSDMVERAMAMTETLAYRNRIVTSLSGGEQTLVMLARIFASEPRLIFADEPVSALDPYHQLHVMEILRNHASADRAAVVVLHDLGLAARYCDRLYLLNHGELHSRGSVEEVLSEANIAEVYGVECEVKLTEAGITVTSLRRISEHHP